jgi:hypothetical protein
MATARAGDSKRYSQMLDPRQGGAAAAVLADLPFDDLAALQVRSVFGGREGGGKGGKLQGHKRPPVAFKAMRRSSRFVTVEVAALEMGGPCEVKVTVGGSGPGPGSTCSSDTSFDGWCCLLSCDVQATAAELEHEAADEAAEEMEGEGQPLSRKDILVRAVAKMGAGIALCAVFSDPLVEALTNLSR